MIGESDSGSAFGDDFRDEIQPDADVDPYEVFCDKGDDSNVYFLMKKNERVGLWETKGDLCLAVKGDSRSVYGAAETTFTVDGGEYTYNGETYNSKDEFIDALGFRYQSLI